MPSELASSNSTDFNNLPEQHPSRGPLRSVIILGLIAFSLALLILPLRLVSTAIGDDITRLESDFRSVQEDLMRVSTPEPEVQELLSTMDRVKGLTGELEEAYTSIIADHSDWPTMVACIGNYNPAQITLTSLTHADSRITLNGRAIEDTTVIGYARALEECALFSRVVVESMKTVATPFATPTSAQPESPEATPTPTVIVTPTATLTPTLELVDEYEMDDFHPKDIFLSQSQWHNFHPVYDVDRVKFLAKAGRYYRVFTSELAPTVDTFLTMSVDGTTYTNDDRQPGDLGSEIVLQVGTGRDVEAVVAVTNRGQYGPDRWYRITVEELVPPPTATPTDTPIPTSTPIPTNTPLATSDLRDEYEPDGADPRPIAIGETQTHNFHPDNDVDKVKFLAKAGRYYRVFSSELALGVDTSLVVSMNGTTYTSDDRQPGDLSSEIVFQVGTGRDVNVLVEVTNRGQYGPDQWYQITVEELLPPPTATPTSTPVPTSTSTVVPTAEPTSTLTPTNTPTPDLRDAYEPDDADPRSIAVGETQTHNFYPDDDVDKVEFLAKAGRTYRVSTAELALGVDTALTVSVDGTTYTNDDRQPGDLSSEVEFSVEDSDIEALVEVTNRGQYSPERWYQITVEEVVTSTASSKLPGLALLMPSFASDGLLSSADDSCMGRRTHTTFNQIGKRASGVSSLQAVEFVIILELKAESP